MSCEDFIILTPHLNEIDSPRFNTAFPLESAAFITPHHFSLPHYHFLDSVLIPVTIPLPSIFFFFFFGPTPSLETNWNANKANLPSVSSHRIDVKRKKKENEKEKPLQYLPSGECLTNMEGRHTKYCFGSNIIYYRNHPCMSLTKEIKFQSAFPYAIMSMWINLV